MKLATVYGVSENGKCAVAVQGDQTWRLAEVAGIHYKPATLDVQPAARSECLTRLEDQMLLDYIIVGYKPTGQAYPTGRLLHAPLDGAEWCVDGAINGERIHVIYHFDADEIARATTECVQNVAEAYPWDAEHVMYIDDDEGYPIVGRGFAGFPA